VNDSFLRRCSALAFWKCHNFTSLHVYYLIFNYSSPPQVAFASLDGNNNGGNPLRGVSGSFARYNCQIHGDGRFAILAAAAAEEAGLEHDSNNNTPSSFAQNNRLIHWEGKFGHGTTGDGVDDDEDDDNGGRDIDFAPPQNCKFSMLATATAAENARVVDDRNCSRTIYSNMCMSVVLPFASSNRKAFFPSLTSTPRISRLG